MNIKLELLADALPYAIAEAIEMSNLNPDKLIDTHATKALAEIKEAICNESLDDFYVVDKIVDIFVKYKIEIGGHHDF